jgi:hypothetical protein
VCAIACFIAATLTLFWGDQKNEMSRLSTNYSKLAVITSSAVALLFQVSPAQASPNVVLNGSFENTGGITSSFSVNNLTALPNWTATPSGNQILDCLVYKGATTANMCGTVAFGGGLTFWVNPGPSPDGGNYVAIDGDGTYETAISQTVNGLVVGSEYSVFFYQAAAQQNGYNGATTDRFQVKLGSQTLLSTLMNDATHSDVPWQSQTLIFTATSASEVLSFLAVGTPSGVPPFALLDGVTMNQVPEPSSSVLFCLGILTIPLVRGLGKRRD